MFLNGNGGLAEADLGRELKYGNASARLAPVSSGFYMKFGKRIFDVLGALFLFAIFIPLFAILSVALQMQRGPVMFGHGRIGQKGREFRCLKFRTMVPDAEQRLKDVLATDPVARQQWDEARKLDPDPRITRIGEILRRSSMDELPQLFNVLRGEMSLVGPRPVTASELSRYGDAQPYYLALRPGLTGLWQVSGRNDVSYDSRVALDTAYAQRVSLPGDLMILLRTVGVVLRATGR